MKFYKETTPDWATPTPNHTYLLTDDKSKVYGYIKARSGDTFTFKNPIKFDARRRTFIEVKELGEIDLDQVKGESWEVGGSNGAKYIVQKIDNMLKCSCPGYTYRGECRHVKQIEETV